MKVNGLLMTACLGLIAACSYLPSSLGGPAVPQKKLPGERYAIVAKSQATAADEVSNTIPVDIAEAMENNAWLGRVEAMGSGHLAWGARGDEQSASIGDGEAFEQGLAPAPIATSTHIFAMDGTGIVSAHDLRDISKVAWVNEALEEEDAPSILGGGLTANETSLFVATGYGRLAAFDLETGKKQWIIPVGAPVRGAPAVAAGKVVVQTADNQTLAFDAASGQARWQHRGIRETAGFFSMRAPVIAEGLVIAAYSSGEVMALRLETGTPVWGDSLRSTDRTSASAAFSGIHADPMVQDGVTVNISATGDMIASALLNGRPLWQQKLASLVTPWASGNSIFVLTSDHQLTAVLKRDGSVRWTSSLAQREEGKDVTPKLFAPLLAGGFLIVASSNGNVHLFNPQNGKRVRTIEISGDIAAPPIVVRNRLVLITQDGTLHSVR